MTILEQKCPSCGAPGSTRVCAFCGTLLVVPVDTADEKEALDDFHHLLTGQAEKEKQVLFLQHGFIPDDPSNLIDAGIRSVALVDYDSNETEPGNAAANRLRAITLKLKLMNTTPEVNRAIKEFESVLGKHEHIEQRESIVGWIMVTILAFLLMFGCIFLIVVFLVG